MKRKLSYSPRFERNLMACYARASEADRAEGLQWYLVASSHARGLAEDYLGTLNESNHRAACGVIAALSPGRQWEGNLEDAETFLDEWKNGARGNELPLVGSYGWCNIVKAAKCASWMDPLEVLGGDKVRAFYTLIYNPADPYTVCIDRHAISAAYARPLGEGDLAPIMGSHAKYEWIARHYRRCAAKLGITPSQFQAIVWITWRRTKGNLAQMEVPF